MFSLCIFIILKHLYIFILYKLLHVLIECILMQGQLCPIVEQSLHTHTHTQRERETESGLFITLVPKVLK